MDTKESYIRCPLCGERFDSADVDVEGLSSDFGMSDSSNEDFNVIVLTCKNCGATTEIHFPTNSEMKQFPYWNNQNNKI